MANEQGAIAVPGVGIPRSLSDRPWAIRAAVSFLDFFRKKPLGGFGLLIIGVVVFFAISSVTPLADTVARVDPDAIARGQTPDCTEAQVNDFTIECFSQQLFEWSQGTNCVTGQPCGPLVRLEFPPSRFTPSTGEGTILTLAPASSEHWLGTDLRGRDVWSRIVYGSQLALLVGLGGAIIAVGLGTTFGVISAYFGGWVDMVIQRITDAFFAFPSLILLLIFSQVIERPNKYFTTFILGIIGVASVIRIARSSVLSTREEVYVLAARTVGASDRRIMARHILPNITAPLIVIFTISIGAYILAEAGLAFLGLGDPTAISWGKMVNEGRLLGPAAPQLALYVGTALTLTVLGFNLLGDALRDVLDPRLRGRGGRAGF